MQKQSEVLAIQIHEKVDIHFQLTKSNGFTVRKNNKKTERTSEIELGEGLGSNVFFPQAPFK